uniref:Protein E6 n=1 Tax=Human papillomavirus type 53 TaxID=333765 RepID=G8H561_HPV53|nr:early protein E6 [Human papillomavirus type 53]ANY26604.1 oncoprotein E6 [Human papillomavirus type 53]ANY26606.1 oncoprotein E6 [Human papillomavirus type 53]
MDRRLFENTQERPRTLHQLCEVVNKPLLELQLGCVFCKKALTASEVYNFAYKDLRVVYRDGYPYGVCKFCLLFYSKVRKLRYYNCSVYGASLEALTKKKLSDLLIRCYRCQHPLTPEEKQLHCDYKKRFHKISHMWTGSCLTCWRHTTATESAV